MIFSSPVAPGACAAASADATGTGSGRTTGTGGVAGLGAIGARIFEMGGSTDLCLGSGLDSSERFDLLSSISEMVSGFGGGATGAGSAAGTTAGEGGGTGRFFALVIGGTPDREVCRVSVAALFLTGEMRSVVGLGGAVLLG